ncbi:fucoxanthin chlorophyll a c [Micractinium conductrix]|uniref:Chlorophyll a-b binding protein, chloroplastic n=1 Tax=Micractinium conductrix TaxID=554055 RepID=A0A2P6V1T6_9CHLO|nr:fucoxanthin chlorophyll a c [Micractinium conductrix]|eukprot:PSC68059.1 fucoxanthin chlorophyll a c [Micractinium conductrix]
MQAALSQRVALAQAPRAARAARGSVKVMAKTVSGKTVSGKAKTVKGGAASSSSDLTPGQEYALGLPGISEPFPNMFDPANFTKTAKPADIKRWRESELLHGRVAMLAALGFVVGEQLEDFPAFMNWDGSVTGPAIYQFQQIEEVRPLFWEALVLCIGLAEVWRVAVGWATPTGNGFNSLKDEYNPGFLGFDPLNLLPEDEEEIRVLQTKELNNGRLAMIGIAGFVLQELVPPHREIFEHLALYAERELILEIEDLDPALNIPVPDIPPAGIGAAFYNK